MQGNTPAHISEKPIIQDYVGLLRSLVINEKFFRRSLNIVALFLKTSLCDHLNNYCLLSFSVKGADLYSTSEQNLVLYIKFEILEQFKLTTFIEKLLRLN